MSNKSFMAVDADKLRKELREHHDFFVNAYGGFSNLPPKEKARVDEITQCIARVINLRPVEAVEVVHAKWGYKRGNLCCMNCGFEPPYSLYSRDGFSNSNYCPNCGATMNGGSNQ